MKKIIVFWPLILLARSTSSEKATLLNARVPAAEPLRHPINTPTQNSSPFNWQAMSGESIAQFRYELLPFGKKGTYES